MKIRTLLTDLTNQCQIQGYDEEPGVITIFLNKPRFESVATGLRIAVTACEGFGKWLGTDDMTVWTDPYWSPKP